MSQRVDSKKLSVSLNSEDIEMSLSSDPSHGGSAADDVPTCSLSDVDMRARQHPTNDDVPTCSVSDVNSGANQHQSSDDIPAYIVSDEDVSARQHPIADDVPACIVSDVDIRARQHPIADDVPACIVSDVDIRARQHPIADDVPACNVSDVDIRARQHPIADDVPACNVSDVDVRARQHDEIRNRREKQLTVMTVVTTLAFLICIMPVHIFKLAVLVTGRNNSIHTNVTLWARMIRYNLMVLNSGINFFLYTMTGSKFRSDLMTLLHLN